MKKSLKTCTCEQCGIDFVPTRGAKGKHCSLSCFYKSKVKSSFDEFPDFIKCTACHAKIGFGCGVSARMIKKDKSTVARAWRRLGIEPVLPDGGSWRHYAQKENPAKKTWWGGDEVANAWMSEYKVKFPDWSKLSGVRKLDVWIYKSLKDDHFMQDHARTAKQKQSKSARESNAKRKIIDPGFRVKCNLRNRLKDLMKNVKNGGTHHVSALIGCSTKQLAKHLESQFRKGMSWDNYGFEGWHVDHIIPCAKFDHNDPKQIAQCWHWTNLRPLWAKENLNKSDTVTEPQMQLLFGSIH